LRNSYKRINPQGAFFFQNFKEQIYCENKFFQLLFTCICFRNYRRKAFFESEGGAGIPSHTLPSRAAQADSPSEARRSSFFKIGSRYFQNIPPN